MNLPQEHMLPSFATLRDYGNTSCSTTSYVMAYLESLLGVQCGQKIMQVRTKVVRVRQLLELAGREGGRPIGWRQAGNRVTLKLL
jgi:hypothetical protein